MLSSEVHNDTTPNLAVWDNEHSIINGHYRRVHQVHLADLAFHIRRGDEVTGVKRSIRQNHGT